MTRSARRTKLTRHTRKGKADAGRADALVGKAMLVLRTRADTLGLGWPPTNQHVLHALQHHAGSVDPQMAGAAAEIAGDLHAALDDPADELLLYLLGLTLTATGTTGPRPDAGPHDREPRP